MSLPLAPGTFLNATATALMTMSFTETLTSCCSVIEEVKWTICQSIYAQETEVTDQSLYSIPLSSFLIERRGSSTTSNKHHKYFRYG